MAPIGDDAEIEGAMHGGGVDVTDDGGRLAGRVGSGGGVGWGGCHVRYGRLHSREKAELLVQAGASLLLIVALVFHLTEVGFVGLAIVILVTTLNGETVEHDVSELQPVARRHPTRPISVG
jgi:hypothetical protein